MSALTFRLTEAQTAFFEEEGYLVVDNLFTPEELLPVIAEIDAEVNRQAEALVAAGALSRTYVEYGFERQLAKISEETDTIARSIWNGALAGPALFDLIRHPKLLDIAEQFCGSELIASSVYRLRPKIPRYDYGAVPWHQDSGYFEPYCDSALVLTVWLPLVDADAENGCLWVIPRAHRGGVVRHAIHPVAYLFIPEDALPPGEWVCAPVRKGGILLLTNRTPHASFENSSDIVRWSLDLRYQNAALPTNAPITRLEGEVSGSEAGDIPVACYPPEADFLVRSQRRPQEVVTDPAAFYALRTSHQHRPVTTRWKRE
jgi:ectoine hydroxylase-related dioxygenase (phytanoyl-CoA dioxygenase family)